LRLALRLWRASSGSTRLRSTRRRCVSEVLCKHVHGALRLHWDCVRLKRTQQDSCSVAMNSHDAAPTNAKQSVRRLVLVAQISAVQMFRLGFAWRWHDTKRLARGLRWVSSWGAPMGWETPRCTPTSIRRTLPGGPSTTRCGSCWAASVCLVRFVFVGLNGCFGPHYT
jgi:hypothetical protein